MAGDWIKVEKSTLRKPEVATIARLLGVPRHQCIGILLDFWMWLDDVCVDGHVDACVDADVDAVLSTPGLAAALQVVGWAKFEASADGLTGRLLVPHHDRHFGESAKNRSLKSERQARWRANQAPKKEASTASTRPSTTPSTREEKRREEITPKPKTSAQPAAAPVGVRDEVWTEWRKARGKKLTPYAVALQAKQLAEFGGDPNAIIEQSIRNGWAGLFPLKQALAQSRHDAIQAVNAEIWKGNRGNSDRDITAEVERVA